MPILLLFVMAVWWIGFRPVSNEQDWVRVDDSFGLCGAAAPRRAGCVVDGDTVVIGFGSQRRRIRLTGFDAPELNGACDAESRLAITARDRLHQWLDEGPFEWSGGAEPPRDQYGRELRAARRIAQVGRPERLADMMVEAGLASESGWGTVQIDWCE